MSNDAMVQSMRNNSDEELLAIATGTAFGYTDQARAVAEAVLRERRVQLPTNLRELRKSAASAEAEADRQRDALEEAHDQAHGRAWGIRLMAIGVGGFILPFFGLQFRVLMPFGWAVPIAAALVAIGGFIMFLRASKQAPDAPPIDKEP